MRRKRDYLQRKKWRDLETGGRGRLKSLKWRRSIDHITTFCWSAIVSIALSSTIFEIKRHVGRKSRFFIPFAFAPSLGGGGTRRNIAIPFDVESYRMVWLPDGEKSFVICLAVLIEYRRVADRRTDGQISRDSTVRAMHSTVQ